MDACRSPVGMLAPATGLALGLPDVARRVTSHHGLTPDCAEEPLHTGGNRIVDGGPEVRREREQTTSGDGLMTEGSKRGWTHVVPPRSEIGRRLPLYHGRE